MSSVARCALLESGVVIVRDLRVIIAAGVLALAVGCGTGTKQSSVHDTGCGSVRDGFVTVNERWESSGPWHVKMSSETARSIARRVGPKEFQPPSSHPAAKEVPCVVASSVAFGGANARSRWRSNSGSMTARWASYAAGPSFGRFSCTGVRRRTGGAEETCIHRADRHAGQITVQFVVRPDPYYPHAAALRTFAGRWQGHGRGLTITKAGRAAESVYSGCCYLVIALKFELSRPRGTRRAAAATATVTAVRIGDRSWFTKAHPPPHVGESRTIRLRDGVISETLTGINYCAYNAKPWVCGA